MPSCLARIAGCPAASLRALLKMSSPVAGAPSYATLIESACSIVPSVSMTTTSLASSPSDSVRSWRRAWS